MSAAGAQPGVQTDQLVCGLIGVAALIVGVMLWTGRWRGLGHTGFIHVYLTVVPFTGPALLFYAVSDFLSRPALALLGMASLLCAVAGYTLFLMRPARFGPAWFRELTDRTRGDTFSEGLRAMGTVPPGRNSEQLARAARRPRKPSARRKAILLDPDFGRPSAATTEGAANGYLLLYPDELVFVADREDDALRPGPTVRSVAADDITGVGRAGGSGFSDGRFRLPRLRVTVRDGADWEFEAFRPQETLRDLRRLYPRATAPDP